MTDWMGKASCRYLPPKLFYPDIDSGKYADLERIRKVCAGCPVRDNCLDMALTQPFKEEGFWGGTAVTQRRNLKRLYQAPYGATGLISEIAGSLSVLDGLVASC